MDLRPKLPTTMKTLLKKRRKKRRFINLPNIFKKYVCIQLTFLLYQEKSKHSIRKVYMVNRPEWVHIFFGCVSSIIAGGIQPAFGVVLSKAIDLFSLCSEKEQSDKITLYCLIFLLFAVLSLVSQAVTVSNNFTKNFILILDKA
jgi:hypothetical protein